MNLGQYKTQLDISWDILSELNLAQTRNWSGNTANRTAAEFRNLTYTDTWKLCFGEQYYDFMLKDYALLQYRVTGFKPLRVSFNYLECPFKAPTYTEFIEGLALRLEDVGDELKEEYELELLSAPIKDTVTPIRYDFDPESYDEGLHPASHIHFGFGTNIRIGAHRVLHPLSFTLFIVRQCYGHKWKTFLTMPDAINWCRYIREHLEHIDERYLRPQDEHEMMLL
jgi:hypothetical protein